MNRYAAELEGALREIKLTALAATDGPLALAHIIRLCIDVGIEEKLERLQAMVRFKNLEPERQKNGQ